MSTTETLQELGSPLRQLHARFSQMVDPVRPALWRYCLRLTGSPWDAEDLAQETLTRAFTRLTGYWQPIEPKPYLFRIATNAWIDIQRKNRIPLDNLETAPEVRDVTADEDPSRSWGAMETLVGLLPARQRVIVLLIDVFDFTAAEVAAMTGATEGAVKAALHRARERLRRHAADGAPMAAAPRAKGNAEAPKALPNSAPPSQLVARYIDAFNKRDVDAMCALLSDDVISDIVGVAEEVTLEVRRKNSMTEWAEDPQPMWAEPGMLAGCEVLFIYYRTPEHERALAWIITLEESGGKVVLERNYCFCPDLLSYAAESMGEPTWLYGYHHTPPAANTPTEEN